LWARRKSRERTATQRIRSPNLRRRNPATMQSRAWQTVFGDKEIFIRILAGQSNCDIQGGKKVHGRSLVGGLTLLLFPRPDLRVRTITYDPANLGILTCVTIGIGPTDSVLWIAAYIPSRGGKQEGEDLEAKLRAWYFKCRAPKINSGEEKATSKKKFDAISWIWDILIPDRVARSALNRSHVGVIMTGISIRDTITVMSPADHSGCGRKLWDFTLTWLSDSSTCKANTPRGV
jgi:hypothetical protein